MHSKFSRIKEFFIHSRGERNGILLLLLLILVFILAPLFYRTYNTSVLRDDSQFNLKVDSFFSSLKAKTDESIITQNSPIENEEVKQPKEVKYFYFDPNTVNIDEMVLLGLSVKQALVVKKYRDNGGIFRLPKDFAKVYVIDSLVYKKLKPWIKINPIALNTPQKNKGDSSKKADHILNIVELNTADTLELVKIRGIGKVSARRIIAYRNLIGGYTNIRQLSEVYGIKPEMINEICKFITVDSTKIKTINLNLVSYEELKKHPYISDYQAKAIIYYRSKVGMFKNTKELVENKILPYDKFVRLKNYFTTY